MNLTKIENYLSNTQKDILETLKCYDNVYVTKFPISKTEKVSVGICIKSSYSADERESTFQIINVNDIYNVEEQDKNFYESFGYKRRLQNK